MDCNVNEESTCVSCKEKSCVIKIKILKKVFWFIILGVIGFPIVISLIPIDVARTQSVRKSIKHIYGLIWDFG